MRQVKVYIWMLCVLVLLVFGIQVTTVQATLYSVDSDAFAHGTDISDAFSGVTLSLGNTAEGWHLPIVSYTHAQGLSSTGTNIFAPSHIFWIFGTGLQGGPLNEYWLRADFASFVDSVSLDAIGDSFPIPGDAGDYGLLLAYNASDVLIDSYQTSALTSYGMVETMSVTTSVHGDSIAYILASAYGHDMIALDNLQYNVISEPSTVIPEPNTLVLFGLGFLGLVGYVYRRKRRLSD